MKPYVVAGVFARGGSKGLPRKNIRVLAGKPLIAYAIDAARSSAMIDRVFVSTDDTEIADVARQCGADVPFMRPAELSRDDSSEWLAWQHAVRELEVVLPHRAVDVLVSVPTTAPLRAVQDVDRCIETLLASDADIVITVTPARRSPYFNMVTLDDERARLVIEPADGAVHRRQDAPLVYDITTAAYAVRRDYLLSATHLLQGKVRAVVVPESRALDIDSEMDLRIAEFILTQPVAAS